MRKSVKDVNRQYKAVLEKRKEVDKKVNKKHLARKRKQETIKEIKEKRRLLL